MQLFKSLHCLINSRIIKSVSLKRLTVQNKRRFLKSN